MYFHASAMNHLNCAKIVSPSPGIFHRASISCCSACWNILIADSGFDAINLGSTLINFLANKNFRGLHSWILVTVPTNIAWHSFLNSNTCKSLTFLSFINLSIKAFAANPTSISFDATWCSDSETSNYEILDAESSFSSSFHFTHFPISISNSVCSSEITNGTRGASDWNIWRYGSIMEAVEAKKASFAGISGSCTADLTVTKELVAGILSFSFFNISETYVVMWDQISRALSATFLSSSHLWPQNWGGKTSVFGGFTAVFSFCR